MPDEPTSGVHDQKSVKLYMLCRHVPCPVQLVQANGNLAQEGML